MFNTKVRSLHSSGVFSSLTLFQRIRLRQDHHHHFGVRKLSSLPLHGTSFPVPRNDLRRHGGERPRFADTAGVVLQHRTMMAGHNKWSKIRHKKGAKDAKRAVQLGKASRSITAASKESGGDTSNLRLQAAIAHARAVQLPKDRIQEAIDKGLKSGKGGNDFVTLRFDAMMKFSGEDVTATAGQVACIITALSDNRNRTTQNVRHLVSKAGGELLPTNHLNYLFHQVGVILVEQRHEHGTEGSKGKADFEEGLMYVALESGAINVEELEEEQEDDGSNSGNESDDDASRIVRFVVTTEERDLWQVFKGLQQAGYTVTQFEHRYILQDDDHGGVELFSRSAAAWQELEDFLDKLDDNEDVTNVYHNAR
jgi:transcriptional/translational regulatory protein YebC/TACO1